MALETPAEDGGGADEMEPPDFESKTGPDLSTVTAFFNLVPFLISPRRASRPASITGGGTGTDDGPPPNPGGGGGGGGGGGPAMFD